VEFVTTRHGPLAYLRVGTGRPFVLIHGNTMTAASQQKLAQRFADEHEVISVDMLGHGQSARPEHLFSSAYFTLQGEALADLLAALFPDDAAVLFGMSAGGVAALNATCECPRRIAALILDSAFSYVGPETLVAHRDGMDGIKGAWEHFMQVQHGGDWWPELRDRLMGTIEKLAETMDSVTPCITEIFVPTLIFQGGQDPFVHETQGRELATTIPGSRLVYDPEAGHILAWRNPDKFREQVRHFLRGVG
jgi:pimeloyl-ACP methyl ester carboxylesterase